MTLLIIIGSDDLGFCENQSSSDRATLSCEEVKEDSRICSEWSNIEGILLPETQKIAEEYCSKHNGKLLRTSCPKENNVGGCIQGGLPPSDEMQLTVFYYSPFVEASSVQELCLTQGEDIVNL